MSKKLSVRHLLGTSLACAILAGWMSYGASRQPEEFERDRVQPFVGNPYYWQYRGQPLLLFGGTHDDNPFNAPTHDPVGNDEHLHDHLDLLASSGGNYLRNTMSHRDIFNVYPYAREPDLFHDSLHSAEAWVSTGGEHAHDPRVTLDGTGSLTISSTGGTSRSHILRTELAAADFTDGMIEARFWVRNLDVARQLDRLEITLESNGRAARRVWPGQIMGGWHLLVFHIDEFAADGFDPSAVDAVRLGIGIQQGAALEEGDVVWDDLAVRGRFDLEKFNPEYWERFESFLDAALQRDLIVQIELWDKVELFNDGPGSSAKWHPRRGWSKHPFNPRNNINYTAESSGLKEVIDWSFDPNSGGPPRGDLDVETIHPFWYTPPSVAELLPGGAREMTALELTGSVHQRLMRVVLPYQEAFVDKVLEVSLGYPNVLYTINNETWLPTSDWSDHWAAHLRRRAHEAGRGIEVGDMRGEHRLSDAPPHAHLHIIQSPDLYSFIDISQNNGRRLGDEHWRDLLWARAQLASAGTRPMNNTKIYNFTPASEQVDPLDFSIQKYWRNILGGAASSRFHRRMGAALHRPFDLDGTRISGESNDVGLAVFRSTSMFIEIMDVFAAEPSDDLLLNRGSNEAYGMAVPGKQYAVYLPAGGSVEVAVAQGSYTARWLDIMAGEWLEAIVYDSSELIPLAAPVDPHALVVLERIGD